MPSVLIYSGQVLGSTLPAPANKIVNSTFLIGAELPSLVSSRGATLVGMGLNSGLLSTAIALQEARLGDSSDVLAQELFTAGLKISYWNVYVGSTRSPEDPFRLATAAWNPDVILQPSVWGTVAVTSAINIGLNLVQTGGLNSVWATGESYWRGLKVPFWEGLGLALAVGAVSSTVTAIGEEAFFRGTGYAQIRSTLGNSVAGFADTVLFVAAHIPQEVRGGLPMGYIARNALVRGLAGSMLRWAFDEVGLEGSVAAHMGIDLVAEVGTYLLAGGNSLPTIEMHTVHE